MLWFACDGQEHSAKLDGSLSQSTAVSKKWRYFANILNNLNILYIESDFKNICAIINLFRPPIAKVDDEDHIQAYNEMVILSSKENLFQKRVDSTYKARILKSKKRFDVKTIVFPDLTEEYIQSLTHGVYQLKQAIPYTKEHIDKEGNFLFELYEEEINILHVKIRSRYSNQLTHNIWVGYEPEAKLTEGQTPIQSWYCDCKAGARVFGMCAHITSLLWYLGIGRHNPEKLMPKKGADKSSALLLTVRTEGLEPTRLAAPDPKSGSATSYDTSAGTFGIPDSGCLLKDALVFAILGIPCQSMYM